MFTEHQPLIAEHARTPEGFADVVQFVITTQNQYFYRVGEVIDEIAQVGFEETKYLTPGQNRGIAYTRLHAPRLLDDCKSAPLMEQLRLLIEIPHIGIVKAGFITQMCYGRIGCLDRHNLRTAGLSLSAFARIPQSTESLTQRLATYITTCNAMGTSAWLWDGWCRLIATKYPQQFRDAEAVSWNHVVWTHSV